MRLVLCLTLQPHLFSILHFILIMPNLFFFWFLDKFYLSLLDSVPWDMMFYPQEYSTHFPFIQLAPYSSLIHQLKRKFLKEAFSKLSSRALCSLISKIHITTFILFYCYYLNCQSLPLSYRICKDLVYCYILPVLGTCDYSLVVVE